jgi:hypothetical protein
MTCSKFTQNALNLCWQKFGGKLLSLPAFQSKSIVFPRSHPMVVQYKRTDNQHQFSIQGEATEKEVEALLQRFQELLHPEPDLQVNLVLDCSDYFGRRSEDPAPPEVSES